MIIRKDAVRERSKLIQGKYMARKGSKDKEPKGSRKGFKTKISSNGFERTVTVGARKKKKK